MSVKRFIAVNLLLQLECIISSPFLQIYCIVTACLIYKFIYMLLLFLGYAVRNTITWQLAVLYSSCLRFNVFYDSDYESTVFFSFCFLSGFVDVLKRVWFIDSRCEFQICAFWFHSVTQTDTTLLHQRN